MFHNCLAAALRHLARNRLYTAISVVGLAVGLCVALIAALVIRNQYSYDHDVPGYERTYIMQLTMTPPGLTRQYTKYTAPQIGPRVQLQIHDVAAASRVLEDDRRVQYGSQSSRTAVYWADPNLSDVLPLPQYAGNVATALRTTDSVVISHDYARRIFGRDVPLGEVLLIDGHPMVVRAIIQDRAGATHLQRDIIASGISAFSPNNTPEGKAADGSERLNLTSGITYLRLRQGADARHVESLLDQMLRSYDLGKSPFALSAELIRIDRFNTHEGLNPGFSGRMAALGVLGVAVLLVAAVNFISLQTTAGALRAREVSVRSIAGAHRLTLITQFMCEAFIHTSVAVLLALALTEWLLPQVDAFLDTGAVLDYRNDIWLVCAVAITTLLVGTLVGAWPAFVLSRLRPTDVLRGSGMVASGRGGERPRLVALQFAFLITLGICAGVVYRQREFAMHEALRLNGDEVLMISTPPGTSHRAALPTELRFLPGVKAVAQTSVQFLGATGYRDLHSHTLTTLTAKDGGRVAADMVYADFSLFNFYGIKPVAGVLPANGGAPSLITDPTDVVINETAARKFGLGPPSQAIGKSLSLPAFGRPIIGPTLAFVDSRILAVVPDFSLNSVVMAIAPTIYIQPRNSAGDLDPDKLDLINVRLNGGDISQTLGAIDTLWRHAGNPDPPRRFFLDEHIELLYQSVLRQSQAFGICALIALGLSCIGLFALTAAAAERRTKEIGVRKALGAGTPDVLKLLLWQFSKPVIWANLIAWPVTAYVMSRWLAGFAYHIPLPLWLFPTAAGAALLIALLTVSAHSILVARARPVTALRYE